jgi:hypothetical protein
MTETEAVATEPLLAGAAPTPWSEVRQLLAKGDTYWLATVSPGGPRHVRPVLAVWLDGRLHFCASPRRRIGQPTHGDHAGSARRPGACPGRSADWILCAD